MNDTIFNLIVSTAFKENIPGGAVVKNLPCNAGDMGSTPSPERSHMPWSNKGQVQQPLSLPP